MRRWVRVVGTALVAALVATVAATAGGPGEPEAASQPGDDRFPLEVGRPDLGHVADEDLTVAVGPEEAELPAGPGQTVPITGTRGVSALVRLLDGEGHVAGMSLVPKDDVALLGLAGAGSLDVPVDYRTTAFALFASQPGLVSTEPTMTTVLAALAADLPELDALATELDEAAADDPAYLEDLPDPVAAALDELMGAFLERAERLDAELGDNGPDGPGDGSGAATTTRDLRGRPAQTSDDPDGCGPPRGGQPFLVVDTSLEDHVCLTEVDFAGGSWEVQGVSFTPRWAVARPINQGVPADAVQWVPGKALSLPSLQGLASDLARAAAEGAFDEVANAGINLCNGLASFLGRRCADLRPGLVERFTDRFGSYFEDARLGFRLDASEARTVMSVNGWAHGSGSASGGDVFHSSVLTMVMNVVIPAIGIVIDVGSNDLKRMTSDRQVAVADFVDLLARDADAFIDATRIGSARDRLAAMYDFTLKVIRAAIESNLLQSLISEFFRGAGADWVVSILEKLARAVGTGPLTWIDVGLGAVNMGATLLMLADDLPELSTSARYAFGYDEVPDDASQAPPGPTPPGELEDVGNPALPDDACGLRVALVLDRSGSIANAGDEAMSQVRDAATGLVDALGTTPSSVRISAFDNWPATQVGWTSLADPDGRRTVRQAASGIQFDGDTNWEAALLDVFGQDADLVVFVTDGNPTTYGNGLVSTPSDSGSGDFDPAALAAGVEAANLLKTEGTRVVAVGVGDVNVDGLQQVSGPDEGTDWFLGDLSELGTSLATVASALCGTSVVVRHLVDGIPTGGAEYSVEVPGSDAERLVTAADGTARVALPDRTEGSVTIQGPLDQPLASVDCERGGLPVDAEVDDVDRTVSVDVAGGPVTCTFAWRALEGAGAALGEIVRGPGELRVVSFEPIPDVTAGAGAGAGGGSGAGGPVIGCFGSGGSPESCASVAFGVSFEEGFAVLRHDDGCDGCRQATLLEILRVGDGVRFRLEVGGPLSASGDTGHLDLTVRPGRRGPTSLPSLAGTVYDTNELRVDLAASSQADDVCLARHRSGGRSFSLVPTTRSIGRGTGC